MGELERNEEWDFSLSATVRYVDELEESINSRRIYTRRPDIYPFDTVAGEMLAKAFGLCRAVIALLQSSYPDEAFGLCRSLYEISIYLRYITCDLKKRDELSRKFLEFGVISKGFWRDRLNRSPTLTDGQREEIARYSDEYRIPDDPKPMFHPWSGEQALIRTVSKASHPIDADDSSEDRRDGQRAISYQDTSCYVHCTQPGLNTYCHSCGEPIRTMHPYVSSTGTAQRSRMVIQVHLQEIIGYCLYGMQVESLDNIRGARSLPTATA